MSEDVVLAPDVLLDQMVLALVLKDDVDLLGAGSADVRAEHDVVGALAVHVRLVELAIKELDVAAAAVDVLLMLHGELDHQRFVPVKKKLSKQHLKMAHTSSNVLPNYIHKKIKIIPGEMRI